jgi:hypothetical protein
MQVPITRYEPAMIERKTEPPSPPTAEEKRRALRKLDQMLDEALEETFPASDPVAITQAPQPTKPLKRD